MAKKAANGLFPIVGAITMLALAGKGGGKTTTANCQKVTNSGGEIAGLKYLEVLTPGAASGERLPMLIVFHSLGTTPDGYVSWAKNLQGKARVIIPQGPIQWGSGFSWSHYRAATSHQDDLAEEMEILARILRSFISQITKCRPTEGRPVVVGSSQGGHMSYLMATKAKDLVHGAVAAAGWLPKSLWSPSMSNTAGYHGVYDETVPYQNTYDYWITMQQDGAPIVFKSFDTGHDLGGGMGAEMRHAVNVFMGFA